MATVPAKDLAEKIRNRQNGLSLEYPVFMHRFTRDEATGKQRNNKKITCLVWTHVEAEFSRVTFKYEQSF